MNEKERHSSEQLLELSQKVKSYEAQIHTFKIEKPKLTAECEELRVKLELIESEKLQRDAQHSIKLSNLNRQLEELMRDKKELEAQLEIERKKTEADSKKLESLILEYTKDKENELKRQISSNRNSSANLLKYSSESSFDASESPRKTQTVYESLRNSGGGLNILESLQSKLKEKDGEIQQLQVN